MILKSIIVLCTLIEQGYLQESYNFPPNSATGQYGTYPYSPSQVETMNGNYGPNPIRHKKPCTRRMNSNNQIAEDSGSQWIPTYAAQTIEPLERNNLIIKSRSLKDRNFNSKATPASDKVAEVNVVTEKSLSKTFDKTEESRISDPCVTSTTTEEIATKLQSDYKQVEVDSNYYDIAENSNEQDEFVYDTKKDQSSKIMSVDCNNKVEPYRNSRRTLTQDYNILSNPPTVNEQSNHDLKLAQGNNAVPRHSPAAVKHPFENRINKHSGIDLTKPNQLESHFDPTKGPGITHMGDSKVMLMQNTKVCYACSSMSDPTCWNPDRKTTVKYCRVGHDSCVTKTIRNTNELILIRDCARSCDDTDVTGLTSRYKSCSICHYDLCNSAYSIKIYNFMFISSLLAFVKHLL